MVRSDVLQKFVAVGKIFVALLASVGAIQKMLVILPEHTHEVAAVVVLQQFRLGERFAAFLHLTLKTYTDIFLFDGICSSRF